MDDISQRAPAKDTTEFTGWPFEKAPFAPAFDAVMARDFLQSQPAETSAGIGPRLYVGGDNDVLGARDLLCRVEDGLSAPRQRDPRDSDLELETEDWC